MLRVASQPIPLRVALTLALCSPVAFASIGVAGTKTTTSSTTTWNYGDDGGFAYVMVRPAKNYQSGSGQTEDFTRATSLKKSYSHDFLYVRHGDRAYVIDDASLLDRVEDILVPQEMLSRQQSLLGRRQAALGARQARLGAQQAELGAEQARLGEEQARLSTEIARAAERRRDTSALEQQMRSVSRKQSDLGSRQSELGRAQSRLGADQSGLGAQQGELGQQSAELAQKIGRQISALLDDAVDAGRVNRLQ